MSDLKELPKIRLGIYNHYKGLKYEVLGVVRHSESREPMVLYKPLYGKQGMWVRPFDMFCEEVLVEGIKIKRFQFEKPCES